MSRDYGVSVVVPVSRPDATSLRFLDSVAQSVGRLPNPKELVLALESGVPGAFLEEWAARHPFVRFVRRTGPRGVHLTRMAGIEAARYPLLLFTDDDVLVPEDWAIRLSALAREHGVACGPVEAVTHDTVYDDLEEIIDDYRARAHTGDGRPKFVSFPNLGIRRELLPPEPFDPEPGLCGDDMDLGCRLRVKGVPLFIARDLRVKTVYPTTLAEVLARKLKHARGISYVRRRMGPTRWQELEIGDNLTVLLRWIGISLRAPVSVPKRLLFLLMNMTYCFGLIYYFHVPFRRVRPLPEDF